MFDSEFLKRLEYLSLLSKRVFNGQLLAQRRSKQLGGGVEFADHRDYLHGDDLRYLDWNVYARHGDLLLKRFQEEQDLYVYLLLDVSESMNTGEPNKFLFARQLAAALAYIALADLDRVSIVAYADEIVDTLPIMRGKDNVLGLLRFLENLKTSGRSTDLAAVASQFGRQAPRRGIVLILSDLFDQDGFRSGIDRLRHQRFDPSVLQVHSAQEADPGLLGDVQLEDVETGAQRLVTITESKREAYRRRFAAFNADVQQYCRTYGLSHTRACSDVPFDAVLLKMMQASI
ncbi:DUF58 domain-containing protein [Roseimaritima sediminicola]|uniref:DUF58 domain-containing protein n=1 Tax=Roseimaritima sediminicola TaxID=2662066 RepID=UPI0012984496|nr:DUF58 domain-containing protein [Roseimaritima sediminicola]